MPVQGHLFDWIECPRLRGQFTGQLPGVERIFGDTLRRRGIPLVARLRFDRRAFLHAGLLTKFVGLDVLRARGVLVGIATIQAIHVEHRLLTGEVFAQSADERLLFLLLRLNLFVRLFDLIAAFLSGYSFFGSRNGRLLDLWNICAEVEGFDLGGEFRVDVVEQRGVVFGERLAGQKREEFRFVCRQP